MLKQWYFRISQYAQPLLDGLETLDWPQGVLDMQRHWLGRSAGVSITFRVEGQGTEEKVDVFTTRPETVFGVSFLAVSAKHDLLSSSIIPGECDGGSGEQRRTPQPGPTARSLFPRLRCLADPVACRQTSGAGRWSPLPPRRRWAGRPFRLCAIRKASFLACLLSTRSLGTWYPCTPPTTFCRAMARAR